MKAGRQVFCLAVAMAMSLGPTCTFARARAVLVGINDYAANGINDLRGTHADVATMKSLLVNEFGVAPQDIIEMRDAEATHAKIVAAIENHLIKNSAPGDVAVFYFSGHGSQMRDASKDETDGLDETIVAYDSRLPNVFDVSDDELNALFKRLAAKTPNITVILDSCHSGTAARGISTVRRIDPDLREPPEDSAANRQTMRDGPSDLLELGGNFTLISGARANELSNEDEIDGKIQGALTYTLAQVIRGKPSSSYRDIFTEVAARVSARFPTQNPQLEGSGLDSQIFGMPTRSGPRYLLVEPDGNGRAMLNAGAMYGLAKGVELQVYAPPAPGASSEPIAKLQLTEVTADSARGKLIGAATIPSASRALVTEIPIGGRKRTVWLAADLGAPMTRDLTARLKGHPALALGDKDSDFRVVKQGERIAVLVRDGTVMSDSVIIGSADEAKRVAAQIEGWARWVSLLDLSNPYSAYSIKLTLRPAESAVGTPAPTAVSNETRVTLRLENTTNAPLYFALLNLGSSGRIALLAPLPGAQDQLAAGAVFERTYRMKVPEGRGALTDSFKVIAGDAPIDGSMFQQTAIPRGTPPAWNAMQRYLSDRNFARSRDAEDVAVKDWTTAQASLLVTRSAPVLDDLSFAVHYAAPTTAATVEQDLTRQRGLCSDALNGTDCAHAAPLLSGDNTVFEVRSPVLNGQRGVGAGIYKSVGQAFDDAYNLRDQLGVEYVEPLFTVNTPEESDPGTPGARGGDAPPDPIAAADAIWSLKYANVLQAQELVRNTTHRPAGHESEGILVAHPDTGFTHHPENWEGANPRAVFAERGHDYVDDDNDATDPLLDTGLLANPGHGTASSSVIISPPNCQLSGKTMCVTGTGPGARLIPLRVHTSVVVFDTKRLARAITDAAEGNLGGRVDALSIAMGGPPSLTLRKAVRRAEQKGVLLIAAAGNYVQTVVWPARFDSAIAVSAINPRCVPWKHASHGRAVDISAPGEGVWRATFDKDQKFDIGMGAGTTFATGTTAGIATLWLAQFANDPALAALRSSGQLTAAFRDALGATAWRPENPDTRRPPNVSCSGAPKWQTDEYGPGIVDAFALLKRPLPQAATRALAPADAPQRLPQWSSLYDDAVDPARRESDYLALFAVQPLEKVALFETEVLFQYTMNEEVRTAIDELISSGTSNANRVAVRNALLSQDLSLRLRAALNGA